MASRVGSSKFSKHSAPALQKSEGGKGTTGPGAGDKTPPPEIPFSVALEMVGLGQSRRIDQESGYMIDGKLYKVSVYRCSDKLIRADFKLQ